ncbi:MAG TPA: hypothetical protein EYQ28_00775 [Henriciella sp.]|nr:hypothetical protein [Henriciella sp.]
MISQVIGPQADAWEPRDLFFRTLLFKIFNKVETWEALENEFGELTAEALNFDEANAFLSSRQDAGYRNYSAAYIMASAGSFFGHKRKHSSHLALINWMLDEQFPARLSRARRMSEAYELLLSAPSLGPFLAFQFVTDINYSSLTHFSEMEFVVAGPGALDGISKCFVNTRDVSAEQIIAYMANNQERYFEQFSLDFKDLWGRPLQLIDCQNLFCEISKYTRVAFPEIKGVSGRTRIKQSYRRSAKEMYCPIYPEDWGVKVPFCKPRKDAAWAESKALNSQSDLFHREL